MTFFQKYKPYYKQNLILAIPVVISQLGQMTVQIVDAVMVGRLSSEGLAAISFANAIAWPVLLLGMGVAMGLTPLVGRASARGDFNRATSLLKNSLLLNVLFGVVISLLLFGASFFMENMGQDMAIIPVARSYFYWMIASAVPIMIYSTGRQFLEGLGNTTYAMVIVIVSNLLNVALNFALIYGWWIFPEMGAVGAGAATCIARSTQILMFAALFIKKEKYRSYFLNFKNVQFCKFRLRRLLNIGFPISIQIFIEMSAMSLMAIVVGTFGANALAAHQIAINIPSMSFMVVMGLQAATMIRVSQDYGLRLYDSMAMSLKASVHIIVAFMIFTAIFILVFSHQIASIFSKDPEVISMAANFLFFGALFQLSDGIQGVTLGGLRGMMVVKQPMFYAIGIYIFVAAPVGYLCSYVLGMGAYGTWVGFITALTIFAVLFLRLFFRKLKRVRG